MLNPFFEPSENGGISDQEVLECYDSDSDEDEHMDSQQSLSQVLGNQRYVEVLQHKLGEIATHFEKYF